MCRAGQRPVELADVVRDHGGGYQRNHVLTRGQRRAFAAIATCRTAALGGCRHICTTCGTQRVVYRSCGNRHCPKCQTLAKERWLAARQAELLPTSYYHLVFTLPAEIKPLAQAHPRLIYDLLFATASSTLLDFGRDERWLGGQIGVTMVLHTWSQNLSLHPHVHGLVTGGALTGDGRWVNSRRGFLFPVKALSKVFRGRFLDGLDQHWRQGQLRLTAGQAPLAEARHWKPFIGRLRARPWVVYAKRPFAGPQQVLDYLGRYTHRVAISNHRLVATDGDQVSFRWRDRAHGDRVRVMTLAAAEFLRRFLLHVLPQGFKRIRHYGLTASRGKRGKLARARVALGVETLPSVVSETVESFVRRVSGIDLRRCSRCGGTLQLAPILSDRQPRATGPPTL